MPDPAFAFDKNVVFDYPVFSLALALTHAEKANIMAVYFRNVTRSSRCYCPFSSYFVEFSDLKHWFSSAHLRCAFELEN